MHVNVHVLRSKTSVAVVQDKKEMTQVYFTMCIV